MKREPQIYFVVGTYKRSVDKKPLTYDFHTIHTIELVNNMSVEKQNSQGKNVPLLGEKIIVEISNVDKVNNTATITILAKQEKGIEELISKKISTDKYEDIIIYNPDMVIRTGIAKSLPVSTPEMSQPEKDQINREIIHNVYTIAGLRSKSVNKSAHTTELGEEE